MSSRREAVVSSRYMSDERCNRRRLLYCDGDDTQLLIQPRPRLGALMRRQYEEESPPDDASKDWGVAIAIALTIVICLVAFVWIFIELDPYLDDFTGSDVTVTPDEAGPFASPVDATEDSGTD
jgi:hypothetical protein